MKKVEIFKKIALVSVFIATLSSCTKEELNPMLDIKFTIEETNQFEYAEVAFSQLFFFEEEEGNTTSKSNLQNMSKKVMGGYLLAQGGTQTMTVQPHFEIDVVALEPDVDLYLHITDGGIVKKITQSLGERKIYLPSPFRLQANETYEIDIRMDIEEAIVTVGDKIKIDWSKVEAMITKK